MIASLLMQIASSRCARAARGVGVLLFCESDPETLWQCGLASYRALRI